MNFMEHLKQYRITRLQNPISTNAIALYFVLMEYNNMLGWIKTFTVPNTVLQGLSGMSRNAVHLARNELKQKGYIKYGKGSGNQCGSYLIVRFDTQMDTQVDTQLDTQLDTQRNTQTQHSVGPLTKPNINQTKPSIPPVSPQGEAPEAGACPFENIRAAYNGVCGAVGYPVVRLIDGKRRESVAARWKAVPDMREWDKVFENASASLFMQGHNDKGWRADFDWIMKPSNFQKVLENKYSNENMKGVLDKYARGNHQDIADTPEGETAPTVGGFSLAWSSAVDGRNDP